MGQECSIFTFALQSSAQNSNSASIVFGEDEHIVIDKSNLKPADKKVFLAFFDGDLAGLDAAVKEGGNVNVMDKTAEDFAREQMRKLFGFN